MLSSYLKIALKVLGRRKFYTGVNLFGIAFTLLTLMLATAMLDNSLAPGPPEVHLDRILGIERATLKGPDWTSSASPGYGLLDRYARGLPGVESLSITSGVTPVTSFPGGRRIESDLRRTDGAFWEIMEFDFVEGGPFTAADEERGNAVAVINEATRERFFGDEAAVGRSIQADGQAFTVVGVVRDVPMTRTMTYADLWVPLSTTKSTVYRTELLGEFQGIVLARRRADFPAIKAEFASRLESAELPDPETYKTLTSAAATRFEELAWDVMPREPGGPPPTGRFVLLLAALVTAFMAIPALNLVNLSLSRILERTSEIGVRKAFGASSVTLVGQFLVENLVLTLAGGALGFVLSWIGLEVVSASGLIPYADLRMSPRIFAAGLLLSLLFALISGVYPAWRMSRLHPVEALHGRAR
jgi:putative ABC transport system permease protein